MRSPTATCTHHSFRNGRIPPPPPKKVILINSSKNAERREQIFGSTEKRTHSPICVAFCGLAVFNSRVRIWTCLRRAGRRGHPASSSVSDLSLGNVPGISLQSQLRSFPSEKVPAFACHWCLFSVGLPSDPSQKILHWHHTGKFGFPQRWGLSAIGGFLETLLIELDIFLKNRCGGPHQMWIAFIRNLAQFEQNWKHSLCRMWKDTHNNSKPCNSKESTGKKIQINRGPLCTLEASIRGGKWPHFPVSEKDLQTFFFSENNTFIAEKTTKVLKITCSFTKFSYYLWEIFFFFCSKALVLFLSWPKPRFEKSTLTRWRRHFLPPSWLILIQITAANLLNICRIYTNFTSNISSFQKGTLAAVFFLFCSLCPQRTPPAKQHHSCICVLHLTARYFPCSKELIISWWSSPGSSVIFPVLKMKTPGHWKNWVKIATNGSKWSNTFFGLTLILRLDWSKLTTTRQSHPWFNSRFDLLLLKTHLDVADLRPEFPISTRYEKAVVKVWPALPLPGFLRHLPPPRRPRRKYTCPWGGGKAFWARLGKSPSSSV